MRFKDFVKLTEIALSVPLGMMIPTPPIGALPSLWTGSQTGDKPFWNGGFAGTNLDNMSFDIGLPSVTKTAKIEFMNEKTNPILIYLSDGTRIFISYDGFKKIKGEPRVGKMMMLTMQRRPDDDSPEPSRIQNIHCF